ncbi:MAG: metallophosphoesterase [Pseudomonas sp.]|jgi:3',5'-cyclic AMP phosphodiesterase CpdA|uniref:metallophosphoesterase family protein n=1 Tax=Pseudomonas sp. TaxID=306 RepID=UPI0012134CE0|nr:metallophosphoesterase [Pseudomonas sp.]RZI75382.1 MAG: metallophosphoesterase [Pseudomonas sp.]
MTTAPLLLQISDPHFGTEVPTAVRALERLAREHSPDVVVFSGDITQRATRQQFDAARAFADRLGARDVVAIPGNHDIPLFQLGARLLSPYGRYRRAFGDDLEPVFESDAWLVIGVNTTRWYRHEDGEVSTEQIERVAERLSRARPEQVRLVVTHQPVLVTRTEDEKNRLHGREDAVARWSAAGADLILGGHIHLPFVRPLQGAFTPCPRAMWAVQAGTAVSTRLRSGQPNSVNILRRASSMGMSRRSCTVERWDCAMGDDRFVRADVKELLLDDAALSPSLLMHSSSIPSFRGADR